MSDTIKKWHEMQSEKNNLHESLEEKRERDILELISLAVKGGKIAAVSERAAEVQKEFNGASLLVALQIACDENGLLQN
tara:strand:+ start:292 stop:528 length:237 start_codon:yes stop_codon:yes gene_type:complete